MSWKLSINISKWTINCCPSTDPIYMYSFKPWGKSFNYIHSSCKQQRQNEVVEHFYCLHHTGTSRYPRFKTAWHLRAISKRILSSLIHETHFGSHGVNFPLTCYWKFTLVPKFNVLFHWMPQKAERVDWDSVPDLRPLQLFAPQIS